MLTHIDTKAPTLLIWASLVYMTSVLQEHQGDITKFNAWVLGQVINVFMGGLWYSPWSKFVKYIDNLHDAYNDDSKDYSAEDFMQLAEGKYKDRVLSGVWKKSTKDAEAIVALNAELTELRKSIQELMENAATQTDSDPKIKKRKSYTGKPKWVLGNLQERKRKKRVAQSRKSMGRSLVYLS